MFTQFAVSLLAGLSAGAVIIIVGYVYFAVPGKPKASRPVTPVAMNDLLAEISDINVELDDLNERLNPVAPPMPVSDEGYAHEWDKQYGHDNVHGRILTGPPVKEKPSQPTVPQQRGLRSIPSGDQFNEPTNDELEAQLHTDIENWCRLDEDTFIAESLNILRLRGLAATPSDMGRVWDWVESRLERKATFLDQAMSPLVDTGLLVDNRPQWTPDRGDQG